MLVLCHDWRSNKNIWSAVPDFIFVHSQAPETCRAEILKTDLEIVSYSATADPASNENRIRALSVPGLCAKRFPVLRFLGR
jgi:hypothetical protein